jgi:hypothetical protein
MQLSLSYKNLAAGYNAIMCRVQTNLSSTSSLICKTVTPVEVIVNTKAQCPTPGNSTQAGREAIISTDSSIFHPAPTSAFQDPDKNVTTTHTSTEVALVVTPCDSPTPPPTVQWTLADSTTASSAFYLTGVSPRLLIPCYCVTPPYDFINRQASPPPPPQAHHSVIQIGKIPDRLFIPLL